MQHFSIVLLFLLLVGILIFSLSIIFVLNFRTFVSSLTRPSDVITLWSLLLDNIWFFCLYAKKFLFIADILWGFVFFVLWMQGGPSDRGSWGPRAQQGCSLQCRAWRFILVLNGLHFLKPRPLLTAHASRGLAFFCKQFLWNGSFTPWIVFQTPPVCGERMSFRCENGGG